MRTLSSQRPSSPLLPGIRLGRCCPAPEAVRRDAGADLGATCAGRLVPTARTRQRTRVAEGRRGRGFAKKPSAFAETAQLGSIRQPEQQREESKRGSSAKTVVWRPVDRLPCSCQDGQKGNPGEERMYSAGRAADAGGCAAADRALRRALQHGAVAQRDQVRDAGGPAGGTAGGDPRRPRPQAGAGTRATSAAPSAGGLTFRVAIFLPGETEAGSAGKQPCRGITRWAHREDDHGRGNRPLAPTLHPIGSIAPHALKIPARRAASTLTRSARSPVPAEPAHWRAVGDRGGDT